MKSAKLPNEEKNRSKSLFSIRRKPKKLEIQRRNSFKLNLDKGTDLMKMVKSEKFSEILESMTSRERKVIERKLERISARHLQKSHAYGIKTGLNAIVDDFPEKIRELRSKKKKVE